MLETQIREENKVKSYLEYGPTFHIKQMNLHGMASGTLKAF